MTQVLSEAAFIKHTASGRLFVVAWQNLVGDVTTVTNVIDRTLTGFLSP